MKSTIITWRLGVGAAVFCALLVSFMIAGFSQSSGPVRKCMKCEKTVYPIDSICVRNDACWHKSCFRCYRCGMQLNQANFFFKGAGLYCKKCLPGEDKPAPIKKNPKPKDSQIEKKSKFGDDGSPKPVEYGEED